VLAFASIALSGCSLNRDISQKSKDPVIEDKQELSGSDVLSIISEEEKNNNIKRGLLKAIAKVESGCRPYAVNVSGKSYLFDSLHEALRFVESLVRAGKTNISIGCLQLHYKSHRSKFSSIAEMLEPRKNIKYAARIVKDAYRRCGNWEGAVRRYHTGSSKRGETYYKKVIRAYNKG
jgi:soluble lytic murein transglycosylase-like protein